MFRKQDFKKVDLLGSGKKNTKIYKVLHLSSGKYYALKEVEAKTLDKLNEYKVSDLPIDPVSRKRQCSYLKHRIIRILSSSTVTSSTRPCITLFVSASSASISSTVWIWSTSFESGSKWEYIGRPRNWRKCLSVLYQRLPTCKAWDCVTETLSLQTCSCFPTEKSRS